MGMKLDAITGKWHEDDSQEDSILPANAIDLTAIDGMDATALRKLIRRVSGAMWGVGLQTPEQREEAMLLKLSILALTSQEAKDVVSTTKEYFDRVRGRPSQSIDLNQKIGIVAIVMEAAKLRKDMVIDNVVS